MKAFWAAFLGAVIFLGTTIIALGQEFVEVPMEATMVEEVCTSIVCEIMKGFPEVNAWLIAIFTFIGLGLRITADLLGFISGKLKHEEAGKWAVKISDWAVKAAQVIGWFGGGTPKVVLEKKVQSAIAGQQPKGADGTSPQG